MTQTEQADAGWDRTDDEPDEGQLSAADTLEDRGLDDALDEGYSPVENYRGSTAFGVTPAEALELVGAKMDGTVNFAQLEACTSAPVVLVQAGRPSAVVVEDGSTSQTVLANCAMMLNRVLTFGSGMR